MKPCRWLRPPTGPISPAAKNPATAGRAVRARPCTARTSWSASGNIVVPRPLQENSSAPRAGWAAPSSSSARSSPAPSASRTWNRTVRPTSTTSPTATAPVSGSAPTTPRMRKSPRPCSSAYSSIATPRCSPRVASSCSAGGQRRHDLHQPRVGGRARELQEQVALGPRDDHRRSDGAAALAHDRARPDRAVLAAEQHADAAAREHLAVAEEAVRPGAARGPGQAADHRDPGAAALPRSRKAPMGNV